MVTAVPPPSPATLRAYARHSAWTGETADYTRMRSLARGGIGTRALDREYQAGISARLYGQDCPCGCGLTYPA